MTDQLSLFRGFLMKIKRRVVKVKRGKVFKSYRHGRSINPKRTIFTIEKYPTCTEISSQPIIRPQDVDIRITIFMGCRCCIPL